LKQNILEKWYDSPDFPSSFVCGDQLTVERIASLIRILDEDGEEVDQLSKLIPAATDWHTRLNYVDVSNQANIIFRISYIK